MGALTHNGEVLQRLPADASQINFNKTGTNLNSTQTENAIKEVNTKVNTNANDIDQLKSGLAYSLYGAIDTSTVFAGTLFKESDIAFLKVEEFVSLPTANTVLVEKIPVGYRPKVNVEFTLIQRNMSFRPLAFAVKTNGNIHIYNYGSEIDSRTAFGDTLSWPIGS